MVDDTFCDILNLMNISSFFLHTGVMPPDEYYSNINNSVYTNAAAKLRLGLVFQHFCSQLFVKTSFSNGSLFISLQFAVELAALLQHPAPKEWQEVAERIKIPFDPESQYHPEFDGYIKGSCWTSLLGTSPHKIIWHLSDIRTLSFV